MNSLSSSAAGRGPGGQAASLTFEALVVELQMLSLQQLRELTESALEQNLSPRQMAINTGLLNATQLAIVETLLDPGGSLPGYEILGLVGRGGMGVVYRARQKSLNRIVALKTVLVSELPDPTALQRFEQEAVALARLAHPHIVAAYDFGKHRGRLFFAMEFVVGEDCDRFVRRHAALDPFLAWGLIRQAASGLAHAAAHGIVHRDIKPANLLLVEPPIGFPLPKGIPLVKIADFGLAHLSAEGDSDARTRLTMKNATLGSPYYMAPEQIDGSDIDVRTDIYALGVTAWHLLAGSPPLAGKPLSQVLAAKLATELPSVRSACEFVPQSSADLIAAMVRRNPAERISDYNELLRRIDSLSLAPDNLSLSVEIERPDVNVHTNETMQLTSPDTDSVQAISSPDDTSATRPQPRGPRRRLLFAAAVIALLAITALAYGAYVWWHPRPIRDMVPTHQSEYLFDGMSLSNWRSIRGGWYSGLDDEGGAVLVGDRGVVARAIPAVIGSSRSKVDYYRLDIGLRMHEAKTVELHFDLAAPHSDAPRTVVQLTADSCQLGIRAGDAGEFTPQSQPVPLNTGAEDMRSIRVERHSEYWWVFVDGQLLAAPRIRSSPPAAEFRLAVNGGMAWFSDVILERMQPANTP